MAGSEAGRWARPLLAAMLLAVAGAAGAAVHRRIPHRVPTGYAERAVSSRLMRKLNVADAIADAVQAGRRRAQPQSSVLLPGYYNGLRVLVVDGWLDNATRTCQPQTPATMQRGSGVSSRDTLQYYAARPRPTIQVYNRDSDVPLQRTVECQDQYVVTEAQKAYIRKRLLPQVVSQLSLTLAPRFPGSGSSDPLQGNDATTHPECLGNKCLRCHNAHFVFRLPSPYSYPDHDLIVLLTAEPDHVASYAVPCLFGADGRPTAIVVNIAPNALAKVADVPSGRAKLHARVLQAFLHGLGFDPTMFPLWKQGSSPNFTIPAPYHAASTVNVLGSPSVLKWLQTVQFRCTGHPDGGTGTIDGAELEDGLAAGDAVLPYWEMRLFKGDILTMLPDFASDTASGVPVVSGLTLAAFEDMGWYEVNGKMGQTLKWLHGQACDVPSVSCAQWPARYTCGRSETEPLCNAGHTAPSVCHAFDWPAGMIPEKFRRNPDHPTWGGASPLMDFCPFRDADSVQAACLSRSPGDPDCQNEQCPDFQVRGEASRCVESTLRYAAYAGAAAAAPQGTCVPVRCEKVGVPAVGERQGYNVVLSIAGEEYTCDAATSHVGPGATGVRSCGSQSLLTGLVTCPDATALCEEAGDAAAAAACDPIADCGGRGQCLPDGSCACFADIGPDGVPLYGMYAGRHCQECAAGYFGAQCKQKKCPIDPVMMVMCHGHGVCNGAAAAGVCECWSNSTHGYWANATACSTCAEGYTGGTCKLLACDPETTTSCGKGSCNAKTLRCTCYASAVLGFWAVGHLGVCDRCVEGYDVYQSCGSRIQPYHGCDQVVDTLSINTCLVNCGVGEQVPRRSPATDAHGCVFDAPSPKCTKPSCLYTSSGNNTDCPMPSFVPFDCNGYPNLYHDCWLTDDCGCTSPRKPQCIKGTDAAVSPDAYDPVAGVRYAGSGQDDRQATASGTKTCACPAPGYRPAIDCWTQWTEADATAPGGVRPRLPRKRGHVVVFEPTQRFEEDFCHCTSPPIPACSDTTKPEWLSVRALGLRVDCGEILAEFGCPKWDIILNVGGVRNASEPDLSVIDCDGWPPPKLAAAADPCGCPFPQFKCIDGTAGACGAAPSCPTWPDLPAVDCLGQMPPVLTLHAPHPCGCPPPPTPTCIPGTERAQCTCKPAGTMSLDGSACSPDDVQWVDCLGSPLEPPPWTPTKHYPSGDPFLNTCDPCPQCAAAPARRRCLPGTSGPAAKPDNVVEKVCVGAALNKTACPVYPPPCPVDCKGRPRAPEAAHDAACECPPAVPVPPCLPGTDGTPPESDLRGTPCAASPQICGEYACGGVGGDLEVVAKDLGLAGDYSTRARDAVITAAHGAGVERYCVQEGQCVSDYHCAAGYSCGACGLCLRGVNLAGQGCLAAGGAAACGNYACSAACDAEGVARVRGGLRHADCKTKCFSDADCRAGAVCTVSVYAAPPAAGVAFHHRVHVVGSARLDRKGASASLSGVPGFNKLATGPFLSLVEEPGVFVPARDFGECVVPEQPDRGAVVYCRGHGECGGYACGTSNRQHLFANSRCLSTCWVNAHCHPDYRCSRSTGVCVSTESGASTMQGGDILADSPSCDSQPYDHCAPYWCGGHRGAAPAAGSSCPTSCSDDHACQPFYECVFPTAESLAAEYSDRKTASEDTCDATTGVRTPASRRISAAALRNDPAAADISKGSCQPTAAARRRAQTEDDVALQQEASPFARLPRLFARDPTARATPLLVVPMGAAGGYEADPNTVRYLHAPLYPPEPRPPPSPGTAIEKSVAECHPYAGVARGITADQIRQMRATAAAGVVDPNTGTYLSLPACRSYCRNDADCAAGHLCTAPPRTPVYPASTGNRVVARGPGGDDTLGMQGMDEDPTPDGGGSGGAGYKAMCQAKRGLGAACSVGKECASSFCAGGLCCNVACGLPCQTCERMGVCGWVTPHFSAGKKCGRCEWCEYVADADGRVNASAGLECVPIPEGQDPSDDCGAHATCNGEGRCVADEHWGGEGDTCAAGASGPNCEDENVHYRVVETTANYAGCTANDAARLSQSASLPESIAEVSVAKRTATGVAQVPLPATYRKRQMVVDRRPRQWAGRVLGVSSHSRFGCSSILYGPSDPRAARRHRLSDDAWAPGQYVAAPGGAAPDEHPEKKHYPWVNCRPLTTQGACASVSGCKWYSTPLPGYCNGDPDSDAVDVIPSTAVLLTDGYNYDPETIPQEPPLEWIELEFDTAVVVESVVIHESYHPGSIVKIELQPALSGSAALAQDGGGVVATDAVTGEELPRGTTAIPVPSSGSSPESACSSLTSLGLETCVSDVSCFWLAGTCRTGAGACASIGQTSCEIREKASLCYWDALAAACKDGLRPGCYAAAGYDDAKYAASCDVFNDITVYPKATSNPEVLCGAGTPQRCRWEAYTTDKCVANTVSCSSASGKASLCTAPCLWDADSLVCADGEFPNGYTREQYCSTLRESQVCGGTVQCDWIVALNVTGCASIKPAACAFTLPEATCTAFAPCRYVAAPVSTPAPTHFTDNCPELPTYPNALTAAYSNINGTATVSLYCAAGYTQNADVARCDAAAGTLVGTTGCVAVNCVDFLPPAGASVTGYTAEAPFGERQEGSSPVLECAGGAAATGTAPVCRDGVWTGGSAACGSSASSAASLRRGYDAQSAQSTRRAHSTSSERWYAPDHDYSGLSRIQRASTAVRGKPENGHHILQMLAVDEALAKECVLNSAWAPDPSVAGDNLNWTALCGLQETESRCVNNDAGAEAGSSGDRAGKCVWVLPLVNGDAVLPKEALSIGETATYGAAGLPRPFTLNDVGPVIGVGEATPAKSETKPTPSNIRCEHLPAGSTINPNGNNYTVVWQRPHPNFVEPKRYREWAVDVGRVDFRSKNVRITLAPTSGGRSMIDAVGIVGYHPDRPADASGSSHCPGEIWVSPVHDGTRSTAKIQTASVLPVPCNGRGRCGPRGCECFGNFFGSGCEACALGFTGPGCDTRIRLGCAVVAFEDLSEFDDEREVRARWGYENYRNFKSSGLRWQHFGSKLTSPRYNLGSHTHVKLEVGTLMVDVPKSDDCGVVISLSSYAGASDYEVIYAAGCEFFSGLNIIGEERGDRVGFFAVQRRWPAATAVISVEVWWGGGNTGTFVFTIMNFQLQACTWPDIAG
ncbi:Leishmanolysin-like protein [Diplonema papillatum]|nr:Leishmanolysin-like protein [Diplonema papillatum]